MSVQHDSAEPTVYRRAEDSRSDAELRALALKVAGQVHQGSMHSTEGVLDMATAFESYLLGKPQVVRGVQHCRVTVGFGGDTPEIADKVADAVNRHLEGLAVELRNRA